jgi:HEAT repeat protein
MLAASVAVVPAPQPSLKAWSVLERGVESHHAVERAKAVHALGLLLDDRKAQRLAERALGDDSREVRIAAAEALGRMRAASSAPRLRAALADSEPQVVIAAADSLYLLGDLTAYEAYGALLSDDDDRGQSLVGAQMNSLKDPKAIAKICFEEGLGFIPFGSLAYKVFKRVHTQHDTSSMRVAAALKLAKDPDPRAGTALATSCVDKDWRVRVAVVDAIAERDDPALLTAVIPLVEDDNDTVKYEAAAAVARLSAKRSTLQAQ